MKIKGNITYKDNIKLVYINLGLVAICAYLLYAYMQESNNKTIVVVDSSHSVYQGKMIRVEESEAIEGMLKAHLRLAYHFLYDLSEYSYNDNVEAALHLWSYEGVNIVTDYAKEGLRDLLKNTPTRTEVLIKDVVVTGQKTVENLQYPSVVKDEENEEINFRNQVRNNVITYLVTVESYHRIIRGSKILSEEIHTETLEIYTGFDKDSDLNPFGMKCETITRDVERINVN